MNKIFKKYIEKITNAMINRLTFPLVYKDHEDWVMFVLLSNISLALQKCSVSIDSHNISVTNEG